MGVALAAAAVWAVTLRKVEALASRADDSLPSPTLPPPPPPSKQQEVAGVLSAKLGVGGNGSCNGGAGTERGAGAGAGGLRRREVRGGGDTGVSATSIGNTARTNGDIMTRKEL